MIHSKESRKRSLSKRKSSLKEEVTAKEEYFIKEIHSTTGEHQINLFRTGVGRDNGEEPEIYRGSRTKSRCSTRDPRYHETGAEDDSFVTGLVCDREDGRYNSRIKNCNVKTCRKESDELPIPGGILETETSAKLAGDHYEIVDEDSEAAHACRVGSCPGNIAECGETMNKRVCEYRVRTESDVDMKRSETDLSLKSSTEVLTESEGSCGTWRQFSTDQKEYATQDEVHSAIETVRKRSRLGEAHSVEPTNLKGDVNPKETDCTSFGWNTGNEVLARDSSSLSNEIITSHDYSNSDDSKICMNSELYPVMKNYNGHHSKHAVVHHFNYRISTSGSNTDVDTCVSGSSELGTQSEEDRRNVAPSVSIDSKLIAPSISIDSLPYCSLSCEKTGLPDSYLKPVQDAKLFPVSSDCNITRKESKTNSIGRAFQLSRHASDSHIQDLTFSTNRRLGCSVDIYYEVFSNPASFGTESCADDITDSRRQSLEDVVPELPYPSRFTGPSDRFQRPPGFVENLFWWRRPSDITELRSRTKYPCEEEEEEEEEAEDTERIAQGGAQRRHSDNVFGKPKQFLTLRFNRLREMWNNWDKTSRQVTKPKAEENRRTSTASATSIELFEKKVQDLDLQHRAEEKNELIINTLREVVRKCTFMDPLQRPRSGDIYKRLKKLLLV